MSLPAPMSGVTQVLWSNHPDLDADVYYDVGPLGPVASKSGPDGPPPGGDGPGPDGTPRTDPEPT